MLPEYITKRLDKIAEAERFTDYNYEMKAGSNHGDNFLGVMTAITLTGNKGENGKSYTDLLHLLCKAPPSNPARNENFKTDVVFKRELYMYSTVLPAFTRFQIEKNLSESERLTSFPRVFVCEECTENDTYILIMEDLRPKRYEMWPKELVVPLPNELLVMRELGKLHGISFAMKDQRPHEFDALKPNTDPLSQIILHGKLRIFIDKSIERAANALKNPAHKQLMLDFGKTYVETIDSFVIGPLSKEFAVINHGDCWNNNFLFQYSDAWCQCTVSCDCKGDLKGMCLLDFQLARYTPPVLDLLYNIFSSTDKEFRAKHYDELLETYHTSLCNMIEKLGSDPKKLYTMDDLKQQMRKYGAFALLCGPMLIQIKVARAQDIGNLDEYAKLVNDGHEADLINGYDEDTQIEYEKLINGLVDDLVSYGYVECSA